MDSSSSQEAMRGNRSHQVDMREARGVVYFAAPHLSLIVTLCVLVGLALGVACWALQRAEAAEKQALVAKLRTEGFTRALIAKGIDPYPHLTGEDP